MRQLKITKSITNRESASLDKYLQEIGREDLITVEEEVELAQRIRKGDRVALEKLTRANLRFVVSVAKQYQNQGLSLPDLINEGNLGPVSYTHLARLAPSACNAQPWKFVVVTDHELASKVGKAAAGLIKHLPPLFRFLLVFRPKAYLPPHTPRLCTLKQ